MGAIPCVYVHVCVYAYTNVCAHVGTDNVRMHMVYGTQSVQRLFSIQKMIDLNDQTIHTYVGLTCIQEIVEFKHRAKMIDLNNQTIDTHVLVLLVSNKSSKSKIGQRITKSFYF